MDHSPIKLLKKRPQLRAAPTVNRAELEYKLPEGRGFVWIAQSCFPGPEGRLFLLPLFPFLSR